MSGKPSSSSTPPPPPAVPFNSGSTDSSISNFKNAEGNKEELFTNTIHAKTGKNVRKMQKDEILQQQLHHYKYQPYSSMPKTVSVPTTSTSSSSSNLNNSNSTPLSDSSLSFHPKSTSDRFTLENHSKELDNQIQSLMATLSQLEKEKKDKEALLDMERSVMSSKFSRYYSETVCWLRDKTEYEMKEHWNSIQQRINTLGNLNYERNGFEIMEIFEDGPLLKSIEERLKEKDAMRQLNRKEIDELEDEKEDLIKKYNNNADLIRKDEKFIRCNEQLDILLLKDIHYTKVMNELMEERKRLFLEKAMLIRDCRLYEASKQAKYMPGVLINHNYFISKLLNMGKFSEVYDAFDLTRLQRVACKIFKLVPQWDTAIKERFISYVFAECKTQALLKHEHIVALHETFILDNNTFVSIMEQYGDCNLKEFLFRNHGCLPEVEARYCLKQIVSACKYMSQTHHIIHGNLKLSNILVKEASQIKLTDFGHAKVLNSTQQSILKNSEQVFKTENIQFQPPECILCNEYVVTSKIDVWSVGCIFYELLYGIKAFPQAQTMEFFNRSKKIKMEDIMERYALKFPAEDPMPISNEAKSFIQTCLCIDDAQRLSMEQLYEHSYLQDDVL